MVLIELLENIKKLCNRNKISIGCAESITLGKLTYTLGSTPGASKFLLGGIIAYQDQIKTRVLGVKEDTLKHYGAVSPNTCTEMLHGVRRLLSPTIALATTGYAGPQMNQEPVGLVFIGFSLPTELKIYRFRFSGSREEIQSKTVKKAIEILWEKIKEFAHS